MTSEGNHGKELCLLAKLRGQDQLPAFNLISKLKSIEYEDSRFDCRQEKEFTVFQNVQTVSGPKRPESKTAVA